ncbi:reverse transcriptase domain-containing protein [Tanacetum coccineum]
MPFGLKNVGATYQRLVDKAFQKQIGQNLEVYVDDLVIKSRTEQEVIKDIEETFKTLREINMKLNPKKCAFGMREGTFLGYKVNADGLRVCLDKVEAVLSLPSLKCLKDVQRLNGKLASLNRQMKKLIAELPMLTALKEKEELIIYLAAAKKAISADLMTEKYRKQMPIYFVSRALQGLKINYTPMEKLILTLMLSNPEVTRRLLKWSFELEEHDIHYRPRISVKGQFLADFIVERPEDDPLDTPMEDKEELSDPWILFTDGSSCIDGSGAGLIITNLKGMEFTYALRFRFDATNNEAEYEALIVGLRIAEQMGVKNLQANVDLRLVANQVNRTYIAKEPDMIKYLKKVKSFTSTFKEFSIKQNKFFHKKRGRQDPYAARQVNYVLREIHEGSCSMHAGLRFVVAKALRSGYYWPTMHANARNLIRERVSCQHLQANGLVERANRSLGEGIKAWLDERSKNWLEEISHVLWAHRTMIKSSNGETPFSLTYGTKAMILVEIDMPTLRTVEVDMIKNDEALEINLDLLEERREQATI